MSMKQYELTLEKILPESTDQATEDMLCHQLAALADLILDGMSTQLQSLSQHVGQADHYRDLDRKYQQYRQQLIVPLCKFPCPF